MDLERTTRTFLTPDCFDARALQRGATYGRDECRSHPTVQAEATAQARALVWMNERGVYGDRAPIGSITANLQWETVFPGGRPDILVYDREATQPNNKGPIDLIELKMEHGGRGQSEAVTSLVGYEDKMPTAGRILRRYVFPEPYTDNFRIVRSECSATNRVRVVDYHWVKSTTPGVIIVSDAWRKEVACPEQGEPVDTPEDVEEPEERPDEIPRVWKFTRDDDGDGRDDGWDDFLKAHPELVPDPAMVPVPLAEPLPVGPEVPVAVAAALVTLAAVCILASGVCLGAIGASTAAGASAGASAALVLPFLLAMVHWNVIGDPHLATVDGLSYDLQAVGEFHLLEAPDVGIDVQARFAPLGQNLSVLDSVATEINETRVEIRDNVLKLDGVVATPAPGDAFVDLGQGAAIIRSQGKWAVLWPGYQDKLMMVVDGSSAGFYVPPGLKVRGLLGNANGEAQDDLAYRSGEPLGTDVSDSVLHGTFADSWRITDDDSSFQYAANHSTASFTNRAFPDLVLTVADFSEVDIAIASETCQAADVVPGAQFENCVFDVVATGDAEYAEHAALVTQPLISLEDAPFDDVGRLAEDFEGAVPPNFAAPRYSQDEGTSRVAGPVFDAGGYQFSVGNLSRHDEVRLKATLYAFGPVGSDNHPQSVELWLDGESQGSVLFDTSTSPELTDGLQGTVVRTASNITADGRSYSTFDIDLELAHSRPNVAVELQPHNFRGLLGTSFAVDNLDLELTAPAAERFTVDLPLDASPGDGPEGISALETPGAADIYEFIAPATSLAVATNNCQVSTTLRDDTNTKVKPVDDDCGLRRFDGLEPGSTYALTITSKDGQPRTYPLAVSSLTDLEDGQLVVDGPAVSTTFGMGQNRRLSFEADGGRVLIRVPSSTLGGSNQRLTVTAPDGSKPINDARFNQGRVWILEATQVGTYTLFLDPDSTYTGTTDVRIDSVQDLPDGPALVVDGPAVSTTFGMGQNRRLSFEGDGGRVLIRVPSSTVSGSNQRLTVTAPDGFKPIEGAGFNEGSVWLLESTQVGTYQVYFDPSGLAAGTTSFEVDSVPVTAEAPAIDVDGEPISASWNPGQDATLSFEGDGGRVLIRVPSSTVGGGEQQLTVTAPDGSKPIEGAGFNEGSVWLLESTQVGTYEVFFDPSGLAAGTTSFELDSGG